MTKRVSGGIIEWMNEIKELHKKEGTLKSLQRQGWEVEICVNFIWVNERQQKIEFLKINIVVICCFVFISILYFSLFCFRKSVPLKLSIMAQSFMTQADLNEATKLQKRQQFEEERKKRIFNAKQRLYGVSRKQRKFFQNISRNKKENFEGMRKAENFTFSCQIFKLSLRKCWCWQADNKIFQRKALKEGRMGALFSTLYQDLKSDWKWFRILNFSFFFNRNSRSAHGIFQ